MAFSWSGGFTPPSWLMNLVDQWSEDRSPQIEDQTFGIGENPSNGSAVAIVDATIPSGRTPNWSIVSGNESGAFDINQTTGEIYVVDCLTSAPMGQSCRNCLRRVSGSS